MPLEAPPGALSHFLLAGVPLVLYFFSAALVMASSGICAPPSPPSALMSYTTWPLPLCVVIAPFFLAFISGLLLSPSLLLPPLLCVPRPPIILRAVLSLRAEVAIVYALAPPTEL